MIVNFHCIITVIICISLFMKQFFLITNNKSFQQACYILMSSSLIRVVPTTCYNLLSLSLLQVVLTTCYELAIHQLVQQVATSLLSRQLVDKLCVFTCVQSQHETISDRHTCKQVVVLTNYSHWPEIKILPSVTSKNILNWLLVFATHEIKSDNASQFWDIQV